MGILYFAGWELSRVISRAVFRVRVSGRENLPRSGGFILASNHISYFDPPLVGCWVPRDIYFFAKEELLKGRLFGAILRRVNTVPVRRGTIDRGALAKAVQVIKQGYGLAVFPEGTRSKTGDLLPPRPGIGAIARLAECPVVPAYLSGANKLGECLTRRRRLLVVYGEPLSAEWITSFPSTKASYHKIAKAVMARIARLKEQAPANSPAGHEDERTQQIKKNGQKSA